MMKFDLTISCPDSIHDYIPDLMRINMLIIFYAFVCDILDIVEQED